MAAGGGTKAIVAALLANAGIAVAKLVGFFFTRSSAMLAESIHSLADASNQALLLLGGKRARRTATAEHPFGFGRERYFWSFVVAIVLFSLGSLFSLFEGFEKLREPHPIESPAVALGILAVAIVLETISFRTAIVESNHVRQGESWWGFIRHSKVPELPVVLLEDLGALVGLILALIAVGLAMLTGNPAWDAYGTLSIGVLLGVIAIILIVEMKGLLIGESASAADLEKIRSALQSAPGVQRLIHLKTQHLGPEELLVGAKLDLRPDLDFAQVVATVNAAEAAVRAAVPAARVMYLEPDRYDPERPPAAV